MDGLTMMVMGQPLWLWLVFLAAVAVLLARRDDPPGAGGTPEPCARRSVAGWAVVGAGLPVAVIVARMSLVHPGGTGPGGLMALVIGALVAVTVTLTVRALEAVAVGARRKPVEPGPPDLGP